MKYYIIGISGLVIILLIIFYPMILQALRFNGVVEPFKKCTRHFEYSYCTDEENVYYKVDMTLDVMPEADPATFECINPIGESHYAKDKNNVYFGAFKLPEADPDTVVYLGADYVKDQNSVYHWHELMPGISPELAEYAEDGVLKDKEGNIITQKSLPQ